MNNRRLPQFRASLAVDVWVALLVGYLCWPLLSHGGYLLAKDMVFTPHQPLNLGSVGLGNALPRAVPLDALVGLSAKVLDGALLARLVVPGFLLLAGWGAHRVLARSSPFVSVAVAGFAIWNPFVVERLALGQWALLSSYAALWWLLVAVPRYLRSSRGGTDLAPVIIWVAVASLTPSGGIIAFVFLVVICVRTGRPARSTTVIAAGAVFQLPWVLPALLGGVGLASDPDGVAAFALRAESVGGVVITALGLGGVWDSSSMPPSRGGLLALAGAAVVGAALLFGSPRLSASLGFVGPRVAISGAVGLALALASSVPGVDALVRWGVVNLPGGGIIRDSNKWLMLFVVLAVLSLGLAVERLVERWRPAAAAAVTAVVIAACAPILLVPDAAPTIWRTVTPVKYPKDFDAISSALEQQSNGDLVLLPWRAYREFSWGRPTSAYDPASRWFDVQVIGSETLQVDVTKVAGENPRATRVGHIISAEGPIDLAALRHEGVGMVLLFLDDPDIDTIDREGMTLVYAGKYLALYDIGQPDRAQESPNLAGKWVVLVVDFTLLLVAVTAGCRVLGTRRRRHS